jgi:hypothetical protein
VRLDAHNGATLLRHAANSVLSQAFWACEGALYEPTQALHQLIEQSDIATDLPIGSVALPPPALCILPVPAMRTQAAGFDALFVLEQGMTGDVSRQERWLTFGLCRNHASVEVALIDYLCVDASDATIPLATLIERVPNISESRVQSWK